MADTKVYACSFTSPLSLAEIRDKLRELSLFDWLDRDNDSWGAYISASVLPPPHRGMVKIIEEGDHYVVNVLLKSKAPEQEALPIFDAAEKVVFDDLLPAIGARNLEPVDTYE